MSCNKTSFGFMPDGKEVFRYTLINAKGTSASFTDLGGIWLTMVTADKTGHFDDVVLGYDTVEKCMNFSGHLGEPVGRVANRISGASFVLNGETYKLVANSGKNNIHSGLNFYRDRIWDAKTEETKDGSMVSFHLISPDGDQGYPGTADITVSYCLTEADGLVIHYHMTADADTIVNFTNHAYFNLAGHKSGYAGNQQAWIDADTFTIADEASIPTGEFVPVKGTPMDFTAMKVIDQDIDDDYEPLKLGNGYDHNWVLNHKEGELALSAKAYDPVSGRVMEVYTDQPGIQFYTGNGLKGAEGKDGAVYTSRSGYCFETQNYPDAINKPQFPSPILKVGEVYDTTTIYQFHVL